MDSFEVNKFAGVILTVGVIAMMSGFVADIFYPHGHRGEPAYALAPAEAAEAAPQEAVAAPEPIGPLLAKADAASGQAVAKKCAACHTFDEGGANKIGPNLWNVVNRAIGSHEGFSYSSALKEKSSEAWTYAHLSAFLTKPKDFAPGTKMSFAGLKKAADRADLILYLRSLSGAPAALPEG